MRTFSSESLASRIRNLFQTSGNFYRDLHSANNCQGLPQSSQIPGIISNSAEFEVVLYLGLVWTLFPFVRRQTYTFANFRLESHRKADRLSASASWKSQAVIFRFRTEREMDLQGSPKKQIAVDVSRDFYGPPGPTWNFSPRSKAHFNQIYRLGLFQSCHKFLQNAWT